MNIYVGNLDYKVDESELTGIFEKYGTVVDAKIITDKYSGRSKGFGFVEMTNDAEAQTAIEELHESTLGSRQLTVNEARTAKRD